jgi:hypothetical protein
VDPIRLEPGIELHQRFGAEAVQAALGVAPYFDDTGIAQHLEMPGDTWLVHADLLDEIVDRTLAIADCVEDAPAGRLGDCFEDGECGRHGRDYMCSHIYVSTYVSGGGELSAWQHVDMLQNFIDGEYRDAKTDRTLDIVDPSTGEAYVQAPISSAADIDDACRAAARAFESWKRTTPSERSLALLRLADGLEANADEFIGEEVRNTGKPMRYMRDEEFPMLVDHLRYMATLARNLTGLASGSYAPGYDSAVRREPVGVCGQVAPWNYPLMMGVWKFGPALAAGNTVVLKPSDTTPVTTALLGKIAGEHLPPGVLNIVVGDRDTGRASSIIRCRR